MKIKHIDFGENEGRCLVPVQPYHTPSKQKGMARNNKCVVACHANLNALAQVTIYTILQCASPTKNNPIQTNSKTVKNFLMT